MKEILPVIMNTSFERLAVIDDYISFIWTSRFNTCGDFELCVDASKNNTGLFVKDYYVVRDDDENVGIIEDIKIQQTEDNQEMMIISGRFLACLLDRRIIGQQTTVTGTVSDCINTLINENIISPTIAARKINNFVLGAYSGGSSMQAQYTGKNLLDTIGDLCETYDLGFKVTLNESNQFVFHLYQGVDHTYDQTELPYVIFSDKYDNLLSSIYEEKYSNIANAVLVAGEGEGLDRKTVWIGTGETGINRYEVYKDQRQIRSNDGDISADEYIALLKEAGKESLTTYTAAFTGTVYFDSVEYKKDVNVGDLCVIENTNWGIYVNCRLVEVIESVSETGEYSIVPSFEYYSIESSEETDNNAYLNAENGFTLMAENDSALLLESATFDPTTSRFENAEKISDLNQVTTVSGTDLFVVADADLETNKIQYSDLKSEINADIISALTETSEASYSTNYGLTVKVYKYGGLGVISIDGTPSDLTTGWKTLCTLDSAFRPAFTLPYGIGMTQGANYQKYLIDVRSNGTVRINALNAQVTNFIRYSFTYPLAITI